MKGEEDKEKEEEGSEGKGGERDVIDAGGMRPSMSKQASYNSSTSQSSSTKSIVSYS
jgi:hypothetical protein